MAASCKFARNLLRSSFLLTVSLYAIRKEEFLQENPGGEYNSKCDVLSPPIV